MKKLKVNLFGVNFDSSKHGKLRVEQLGQAALDNIWGAQKMLLHVDEFDENHIKVTVERHYTDSNRLTPLEKPEDILQEDVAILFPNIQFCPSFGGYFNIICSTDNLLDYQIKSNQKENKGSKLKIFDVTVTTDKLVAVLAK